MNDCIHNHQRTMVLAGHAVINCKLCSVLLWEGDANDPTLLAWLTVPGAPAPWFVAQN